MIRWIGSGLVALGAAWLGMCASQGLKLRVRGAAALRDGLLLLEQELWDQGTALPELMEQLAQRTQEPARSLFLQCSQVCHHLAHQSFGAGWREAVEGLSQLSQEGQGALLALGEVLGRYEAQSQREALVLARKALEREMELAQEEEQRMGRVYQVLGWAGGAFLIILLV